MGATHWSTRSMAHAMGLSQSSIHRIWRAFGLKPHRTEHFKVSPDPEFVEKVRDLVGLYLNPPDAAVMLCVDHKSQIQALDRTATIHQNPKPGPADSDHPTPHTPSLSHTPQAGPPPNQHPANSASQSQKTPSRELLSTLLEF